MYLFVDTGWVVALSPPPPPWGDNPLEGGERHHAFWGAAQRGRQVLEFTFRLKPSCDAQPTDMLLMQVYEHSS